MRSSKLMPAFLMLLFWCASGAAIGGEAAPCIATRVLEAIRRCDATVTAMAVRGDEIVFVSRKNGAEEILAVLAGKPLAAAVALVPVLSGVTIEAVHPALDAIYALARNDGKFRLMRIALRKNGVLDDGSRPTHADHCRNCRSLPSQRTSRAVYIRLPCDSPVSEAHADPQALGITLRFMDVRNGKMTLYYDPSAGRFIGRQN